MIADDLRKKKTGKMVKCRLSLTSPQYMNLLMKFISKCFQIF